jgi:hypothetical protein
MFKIKDKFKGCFVSCNKFSVKFDDASQEQLEHLFHLGHTGVEATKKVNNKKIDNKNETQTTDKTTDNNGE